MSIDKGLTDVPARPLYIQFPSLGTPLCLSLFASNTDAYFEKRGNRLEFGGIFLDKEEEKSSPQRKARVARFGLFEAEQQICL